ncbi:hypothetical protein [Schleiferilactobacillus harbinensis]|uniref:hypothetical protein n=1 Tax=Schleiferilactobacillus harbinensis TaxID=304207 RepID=UPI0039EBE5E0
MAITWAAIGFFFNPVCLFSLCAGGFGIAGITTATNDRSKRWSVIVLGLAIVETIYGLFTILTFVASLV